MCRKKHLISPQWLRDIKAKNRPFYKFFKPKLAYGFHRDLHKFATSSMDVSDGILIDLKKLIGSSS